MTRRRDFPRLLQGKDPRTARHWADKPNPIGAFLRGHSRPSSIRDAADLGFHALASSFVGSVVLFAIKAGRGHTPRFQRNAAALRCPSKPSLALWRMAGG